MGDLDERRGQPAVDVVHIAAVDSGVVVFRKGIDPPGTAFRPVGGGIPSLEKRQRVASYPYRSVRGLCPGEMPGRRAGLAECDGTGPVRIRVVESGPAFARFIRGQAAFAGRHLLDGTVFVYDPEAEDQSAGTIQILRLDGDHIPSAVKRLGQVVFGHLFPVGMLPHLRTVHVKGEAVVRGDGQRPGPDALGGARRHDLSEIGGAVLSLGLRIPDPFS